MKLTTLTTTEQAQFKPGELEQQLGDLSIHGFKYNGLSGHNTNLEFVHEELGLTIEAAPGCHVADKDQTVYIQLTGMTELLSETLDGHTQTEFSYEGELQLSQMLNFIEQYVKEELMTESQAKQKMETCPHPMQ